MNELFRHEQFEVEVLKFLSDKGFLRKLIFVGGTCLRLCYLLDRYSIDLDFWSREKFGKEEFKRLKDELSKVYGVTDFFEKKTTFLLEIRSAKYPRRLKIEIRKELKISKTETTIAFSKYATLQVRLRALTLEEFWRAKVAACLERKEIRDVYDIEFLLKRGAGNFEEVSDGERKLLLEVVDSFKEKDYKVKLGSLLDAKERDFYVTNRFKLLRSAILGGV
jgi:predicted nucleotidyltransferase component of viral defense system